jgi:secondary thiamine-phosphate synthase enzyme
MYFEFTIKTGKKQEIVDISMKVREIVSKNPVKEGLCHIYVPHATAAVIINENYDPGICDDIINTLEKLIPSKGKYNHDRVDGNAHSHIKASLIGPSKMVPIKDGKLQLGTWQGIAIADFDGPRERKVIVQLLKD